MITPPQCKSKWVLSFHMVENSRSSIHSICYHLFLKRFCALINLRHLAKRVERFFYWVTPQSLCNSHAHSEFLAEKNPRLCPRSTLLRASSAVSFFITFPGTLMEKHWWKRVGQWPTIVCFFIFLNINSYWFLNFFFL